MTIVREACIEIDFAEAAAMKFDQTNPDLSDCHGAPEMCRVDFVVECAEDIYFVEVKDPGNPSATVKARNEFAARVREDGKLADNLAAKFVDTFFYRWAEERLEKSVSYVCLIALEQDILMALEDDVARRLSPFGKKVPGWKRYPVKTLVVVNLEYFNKIFKEKNWCARRVSEGDERG